MTAYAPAYRARVYAPRSVSSTESVVLSPAAGAVHAEAFQVSTIVLSGYKPVLQLPEGRHGKLDIASRNLDSGQLTLTLLDQRTTAGGSNLHRWVTAFTGDASGAGQLIGRKVIVEESLNGGGAWSPFWMGRVTSARLDSRLWWRIQCQDMSVDLDDELFRGAPHASATTAQPPQLIPIGLYQAWGSLPASPTFYGFVRGHVTGSDGITWADVRMPLNGPIECMLLKQTLPFSQPVWADNLSGDPLRAKITWNAGANSGTYSVRRIPQWGRSPSSGVDQTFVESILLAPIDPTEPGYNATLPPVGVISTVIVLAKRWTVTEQMPILVNDTHPVTLLRWMLDGYFGDLAVNGAPTRAFPRYTGTGAADAPGDPWYDLAVDASFGTGRWLIPKREKRREWIRDHILKPFGLALAINESGQAVVIDVRARALWGTPPTITSADLIAGQAPTWEHTRSGAISRIDCTLHVDAQRPVTDLEYWSTSVPDIGPALIESTAIPASEVNTTERALDANGKPITLETIAFRAIAGEVGADAAAAVATDKSLTVLRHLARVREEYRRVFGRGPMTAELTVRRTANTSSVRPGQYCYLDVDELPDPATNARGGQRVMLCTGREERGLAITLSFLDFGKTAVAAVPIVAVALNAAKPQNAVDVTVTLNADAEPVHVDYCLTPTSEAVRPGNTDARWTRGTLHEASGVKTIGSLASGRRVWIRASTMPSGFRGFRPPSAYVYPAGAGYVDLTVITGPSAGAAGTLTISGAHLTWANANTADVVDVFAYQGAAAPAAWLESHRQATLPPASTRFELAGLAGGSGLSWTWLARCRDATGGVSAGTGTTFVTTATAVTAPTPRRPVIDGSRTTARGKKPSFWGKNGVQEPLTVGVPLLLVAADPTFNFTVERAPDAGGSPGAYAAIATDIPGTETRYLDRLPEDGLTYWYRVRHTGPGAASSSYSDGVAATPMPIYGDGSTARGVQQVATLYADDGVLLEEVIQRDASSLMRLAKGMAVYQVRDGVPASLDRTYLHPPLVVLIGGRYRADMLNTALWPVGWNSTSDKRTDISFQTTTSTILARAKKIQEGAITARTAEFTSKNGGALGNLTAVGDYATTGLLANAPSNNSQYTPRFEVNVTVNGVTPTTPVSFHLVIGRYSNDGSGTWTKRDELVFSEADVSSISFSDVGDTPMSVAGLDLDSTLKIVVEDFSHTGVTGSFSVTPYDNSPVAEGHGVEYNTSTDLEMSLTPNATDYLTVLVIGE